MRSRDAYAALAFEKRGDLPPGWIDRFAQRGPRLIGEAGAIGGLQPVTQRSDEHIVLGRRFDERENLFPCLLESTRRTLRYIGRPESASPATGSYKTHNKEQADIIEAAFSSDRVSPIKKVRVVKRRASVEKAVTQG